MGDILKEAIADAKAVRETALENAKMALEEAFTPQIKSMLSAKLKEDDMDDDEVEEFGHDDEEGESEEGYSEDDEMDDEEVPAEDAHVDAEEGAHEGEHDDEAEEMAHEDEHEDDEEVEESNLDLEAIIRELEAELTEDEGDDEDEEVEESTETSDEPVSEGEDDEDEEPVEEEYEIDEAKLTEEEDEDEDEKEVDESNISAVEAELKEYKEAVHFLKDKLHEVNILNAKLLFTNKLFKSYSLDNNQKLKVVETFDRAQTTREIKLVYSTLAEQFQDNGSIVTRKSIKESASAPVASTKPSKESRKVISEETQVANRFKKLAGLIK